MFVPEGCRTSSILAPETSSGQPLKCSQSFEPIRQLRPEFPPSPSAAALNANLDFWFFILLFAAFSFQIRPPLSVIGGEVRTLP